MADLRILLSFGNRSSSLEIAFAQSGRARRSTLKRIDERIGTGSSDLATAL
jgi:hypothetical protein